MLIFGAILILSTVCDELFLAQTNAELAKRELRGPKIDFRSKLPTHTTLFV